MGNRGRLFCQALSIKSSIFQPTSELEQPRRRGRKRENEKKMYNASRRIEHGTTKNTRLELARMPLKNDQS